MGVKCPNCGDSTAILFEWIDDKTAILVKDSNESVTYRTHARTVACLEANYPHEIAYGICACATCNKRFVVKQKQYEDHEWVPIYPISLRPIDGAIPQPMQSQFVEANLCFAVGAFQGCLAMCQVTAESLWRNKEAKGLADLLTKGIISQTLFDQSNEIRLWGNLIKHELEGNVSPEDAEQLLVYLDSLLDHVYVQPAKLSALKSKRKSIEKPKV